MALTSPSDAGAYKSDNQTTSDDDDKVFDGRRDVYERYWETVNAQRTSTKALGTFGLSMRFAENEGDSPLADTARHYYDLKVETKEEIDEMKENGDLPADADLPTYKEQFGTPRWAVEDTITADNADEMGFDSDLFEDDETLRQPESWETMTGDDGGIVVWYDDESDDDDNQIEVSDADLQAVLEDTEGVGSKTAGKVRNSLERHGYTVVRDA